MFGRTDQPTIAPMVRIPFVLGLAPTPLRAQKRACLAAADERVLSVLEIIARDLEKPHSVKHLAAGLRLSPSRLEHLFKKETGRTVKAFVRDARITQAKNMLQDPTLRIKEVAAAVGYADVSNFAHDFRKQYDQSPSQSRSPSLHDASLPSAPRRVPRGGGPDSRFHQQIAGFTNK
jgi:transcriptional regulator GlxA family with amidase domain